MRTTITIDEIKLSDGSSVHDVLITQGGDFITLDCWSRDDAEDLKEALAALLKKHTALDMKEG